MASSATSNGSAPSTATDAGLDSRESNIPSSSTTTSSNPNPFSATNACLYTTELLERILLLVDMKTVLLAQRVSHKFKAAVEGSLLLQRKLFFVPTTCEQALAVADGEDEELSNCAVQYNGIVDGNGECQPDFTRPFVLNPALVKYLNHGACHRIGNWKGLFSHAKLTLDKSSSFWRVYFTQPMPIRLDVSATVRDIELGEEC